jgi:hypothetical protein
MYFIAIQFHLRKISFTTPFSLYFSMEVALLYLLKKENTEEVLSYNNSIRLCIAWGMLTNIKQE